MQTIEIPIPEELLESIDEKARRIGVDRAAYMRAVLSREVHEGPSIDDILAPFRSEVAAGNMTEEELDNLFAQAREACHRDKLSEQG